MVVAKGNLFFLIMVMTGMSACTVSGKRVLPVPSKYKTVQEAINAARATDIVLVAPGTYYEHIKLKNGVTVRSEGSEEEHQNHTAARRTVIHGRKGIREPIVEGADYAVIDGFTLTGLDKVDHHQPGHPHGVQCRGTSPVIINNIITGNGSTGIGNHVKGKKRSAAVIANNVVYANLGLGIGCNHNSSPAIIGNLVYSNDELGIGSKNGSHPIIENNTVYNNNLSGIGCKDGAYPSIRENTVYNNGVAERMFMATGISAMNTYPTVIENNFSYKNHLAGIGMRAGARTTIRGNRVYHNKAVGIALREQAGGLITGNEVSGHKFGGIRLVHVGSLTVGNNKIHDNMLGGIVHGMGGFGALMGMKISGMSGGPVLITGNSIYNNKMSAIQAFGEGERVTVENNVLFNNGL
ncbi:MAG: nitrous oxide reductase family maturation protein NosD [bacterium]